ncbi:MAG TPA: MlaD family protein [Tepidisphaeraceae bacterium]|nr:MlaD family protein [Tepidisphaeraceae bacterium]
MAPRTRNLITGVVVLFSMLVLAWMILEFSGRAMGFFKPKGTPVVLISDRADGLADGSAVFYRGVQVGKVTSVRRTPDNTHVRIDAQVDNRPPLPRNLKGEIRSQSALGNSSDIELTLAGQPEGQLSEGAHIPVTYVGLSLLPPEITDLVAQVQRQKLVEHVDAAILTLRTQFDKAGKVMDSVQQLVGDPKVQKDLRDAIANVRSAAERADRISGNLEKLTADAGETMKDVHLAVNKTNENVDRLSRQIGANLDHLGVVFQQFEEVSQKINKGHGTAAALINDPKLYDELTDTARELNVVAASLARLVDQWEHEGVSVKLGGK